MRQRISDEFLLFMFSAICHIPVVNLLALCGVNPRTALGVTLLILNYPPFIAMIIAGVAPESRISILIDRVVDPWMLLYCYIFAAAIVLNLCFLVLWLLGLY